MGSEIILVPDRLAEDEVLPGNNERMLTLAFCLGPIPLTASGCAVFVLQQREERRIFGENPIRAFADRRRLHLVE